MPSDPLEPKTAQAGAERRDAELTPGPAHSVAAAVSAGEPAPLAKLERPLAWDDMHGTAGTEFHGRVADTADLTLPVALRFQPRSSAPSSRSSSGTASRFRARTKHRGPRGQRLPGRAWTARTEGFPMQTPIELSFQHVEPSEDIKALVHEKAGQLERFFDAITSCHVYIRAPHKSQRKGNLYEVTIEVRVPGNELVVRNDQNDVAEHEHLRVAVRDAFAAMVNELKRSKDQIEGNVKSHDGPLQGKVVEIRHDEDFGQIIAMDNRLIYFHRNSVVDGSFDDLRPRDTVELVVQTGESPIGPQASTVRRIGTLVFVPETKPSRR